MKPVIQSKTLWFNFLSIMLGIGASLKPELVPIPVDANFWKWLATALMVGNTILRFLTTTAIAVPTIAADPQDK